ncbi:class I SAM-dependent methyltransferase [Lachnospiraceae bacterium 29-84]
MEKIGKVLLDDTYYPGEDLYSDGAIEDHLLELVKKYPKEDYNRIIARERDWAVLYHLAHERENILSWYPLCPQAKVLEIGSGCGAVTGAASGEGRSVTCIDLSKRRSAINAVRNQDTEGIQICVGNFQDIEKGLACDFDYATLIGVFEYGRGYIGGKQPYHVFLKTVMSHIKPGGKLLMAIENKFGMKYWAGCTEDHVGRYFEGLEGYPGTEGVRTFSRPELIRILEECGCSNYRFYYPYPDYKLPMVIYSDEYLPKKGQLTGNICNFDRDRLVLMDEGKVFDQVIEDGLFPLYSNSFFVEITKGETAKEGEKHIVYTKFSSGRSPSFAIRTQIICEEDGERTVYKEPEFEQGNGHTLGIVQKSAQLEQEWSKKNVFQINRCSQTSRQGQVAFEYLEGTTLEEDLDRLVLEGRIEEAAAQIQEAVRKIKQSAVPCGFYMTPQFLEVFGEVEIPADTPSFSVADIDLIFSNLIVSKEGRLVVLDCEWTFCFPVPVAFLVYRALHYYLQGASIRKVLADEMDPFQLFGFTGEDMQRYGMMERNFQNYIHGGYVSLGEMYRSMGKLAVPLWKLTEGAAPRRMQVYWDMGDGFSEKDSYFVVQGFREETARILEFPEGAKSVWIDPVLSACILKDVRLQWMDGTVAEYLVNGYQLEEGCFLFDHTDPKIILTDIPKGEHKISVYYRLSVLEEETAALLKHMLNTKERRVKKKIQGLIKGQGYEKERTI